MALRFRRYLRRPLRARDVLAGHAEKPVPLPHEKSSRVTEGTKSRRLYR